MKTKLTEHRIVYRRHIREGQCRYCGGKRTPGRKDCKKCEKYHSEKEPRIQGTATPSEASALMGPKQSYDFPCQLNTSPKSGLEALPFQRHPRRFFSSNV